MAGSEIKKDDILASLIDSLTKLRLITNENIKEVEGLILSYKRVAEEFNGKGGAKAIKDLNNALAALNKLQLQHQKLSAEKIKQDNNLIKVQKEDLKIKKAESDLAIKRQKQKQEELKTKEKEISVNTKLRKDREASIKQEEKELKEKRKLEKQTKQLSSEYYQQGQRLNKLREQYRDLAIKRELGKKISDQEIKQLDKLEKEINELDKAFKKVDATMGQHYRNVGNYKDSIKEALSETNLFSDAVGGLSSNLSGAIGQLTGMVSKLKDQQAAAAAAGQKTSKFGLALKGLGIGAAIALLAALKDGFEATAEGAKSLETFTAQTQTTFNILFKRIRDAVDAMNLLSVAQAAGGIFTETGRQILSAGLKKILASFEGVNAQINEATKNTKALIDEEYRLIAALNKLRLLQQAYTLDMEDQQEISNDVTIGMEQRNEALKQSFVLQKQAATVTKEIADKELSLSNQRIRNYLFEQGTIKKLSDVTDEQLSRINDATEESAKLRNNITPNLLSGQFAALQTQIDASDKLADLDRQQGERTRKRLERELSINIELIRSKKNSTKLLSEELQKQIDNERNTLDEREMFANQQLAHERLITLKIIDLIQSTAKAEIKTNAELTASEKAAATAKLNNLDKEALLREGNSLLLEEQIKALGLSEQLTTDLASAIKKAQDAELKGNENLLKIEEDRLKLKQRLIDLELERQQVVQEGVVSEIERMGDETLAQQEELQAELLKNENVFNQRLLDEREELHLKTLELIKKEYEEKQKLIDLQYKADLAAVDNSTKAEEEKDAEKLIIQEKYNQKTKALEVEKTKAIVSENKKEVEEVKVIRKEQLKIVVDETNLILNSLDTAYQNAADKRNDALDNEIDKRNENIEKQRETNGEFIEFERSQLAKAELAKEQLNKRRERAEKIIAYWKLLAANTENDPTTALAQTGKQIAYGELFTRLAGFYEGTEKVSESLNGNPNIKDGYAIRVHGTERILTGEQNEKLGGIDNKSLAALGYNFRTGNLSAIISDMGYLQPNINNDFATKINNSIELSKLTKVLDVKLEAFKNEIKNIPTNGNYIDEVGNLVAWVSKNGLKSKETFKHKSLR